MKFKSLLGFIIAFTLLAYAGGKLYYAVTDGFKVGNIVYDLPYEVRREIAPRSYISSEELHDLLSQKFFYLDKGCQSYVFASQDGQYVLKFFKYQRYRPQEWVRFFFWVPGIERYWNERVAHKKEKLSKLFHGWQIAYEDLQPETGLVYMQLAKVSPLNQSLIFSDKMGFEHEVNLATMQFLIQRRAEMLCPTIEEYLANGKIDRAGELVNATIDLFLSEYARGYIDRDPAIMQNTGVIDGRPVHVDVGQIDKDPSVYDAAVWKQDLFDKTYKFRAWLASKNQELGEDLNARLEHIIGEQFFKMQVVSVVNF